MSNPEPAPVRIISNLAALSSATVPGIRIELERWPQERGLWAPLYAFVQSFRADYIVLNGSPHSLMGLALLKLLLPFNRCRIVALDILLSRPSTTADRVKTRVRGLLLRRVHRILLYYKDTTRIQETLGLPAERFAYVPFKINQQDLIQRTTPTDGGYIFCGGKTRRDFDTFIAAVEQLPYPVKIVTTANEDIQQHGSFLADRPLPRHIEVIRLDGSAKPFVDLMAASRLVVLPLKPDITGVGIGVYIMAMALGKCVVITRGPSTEGVLTEDLAIVVPPEDPAALRAGIDRAWRDDAHRSRVAANGQRYATALGGEPQLLQSVLEWIQEDREGKRRS